MKTLEQENRELRMRIEELERSLASLAMGINGRTITVKDYVAMVVEEPKYKNIVKVLKSTPLWEETSDRIMGNDDVQLLIDTISSFNYIETTKNQRMVVLGNTLSRFRGLSEYFKENKNSFKGISGDKIALTLTEMRVLSDFQCLTRSEELAKTLFMLMARTGARISDVLGLTEYSVENGILRFHTKKTKQLCMVRVSKDTINLLRKKEEMRADPLITWGDDNYFRVTIFKGMREICKKAGIVSKQTVINKGKPLTTERCNLVSAHVARTTFATIAYTEYGWDVPTIQKAMGHTSPDMTMHYIKSVMVQGEKMWVDKF